MNVISRQKSIMQAALDVLKEIEFVETKLFGIEESYKRAKVEKLRERYADLLSDLLLTMPLKFSNSWDGGLLNTNETAFE